MLSQQWHELDTCLFLPRTKFDKLLPAVFHSIAAYFPRFTPGAKSLLQLTAEEELLFLIKSAWKALQHYGPRKALACEDIGVMADILTPVMPPLQPTLPVELKRALDQEDGRGGGRRREAVESDDEGRRSRFRDAVREREGRQGLSDALRRGRR